MRKGSSNFGFENKMLIKMCCVLNVKNKKMTPIKLAHTAKA